MVSATTKVALVTGAARGIGRAVALRLAEDGFDVAVNDLPNSPQLDELAREIEKRGRRSFAVPADVSLEEEVVKTIEQVVQRLGSLDVMVANAGIVIYHSFMEMTVETFDRVMAINARGTMLCYKYAAKQMIAQGRGGRIIGAASVVGKQGSGIVSAYCASKFAIRGLTQAAAQEFGKYGITVNAYAPGLIDTRMLTELDIAMAGPNPDSNPKAGSTAIAASTPISRPGTPEEIAGLVSYLASDISGFITGQSVSINGGFFFD
ncbi:hypothetical protein F5148DRAFT_534105 [Russula earlei]|uniref:Uncharacterized protein n=1 Tax=Russula earlei TaxID=71964 RepID=A0ACC0TWI8_9AGAM|nr:hypothetical protein F5148DRAFT_534105 [Russula earlei]